MTASAIDSLPAEHRPRRTRSAHRPAHDRPRLPRILLILPGDRDLLRGVRRRDRRRVRRGDDARGPARLLADDPDVAVAVPLNTIFGVASALVLVRQKFRGKAILNALIDLPFAISPVVIGLALVLLYGPLDGWFGEWFFENGIEIIFTPVGMAIATMFVSLPVRRPRGRAGPARDRRPTRSRRRRRSAPTAGRPSGGSRCRRSAGASPTASSSPPPAPWASSARSRSSPAGSPARPRRCRCSSRTSSRVQRRGRLRRLDRARADRPDDAVLDEPVPQGRDPVNDRGRPDRRRYPRRNAA